ncbi:hypothetical protein NC651_012454 [Populus alba x Populus x berolinensis]|nr:hypothetical protein NC651_012454 [Populus alba x Populus x berolinensis]
MSHQLTLQADFSIFPFNFPCKLPSPPSKCKPHLSLQLPLQAAFAYKYMQAPPIPSLLLSAVSDSRFTPLINQGHVSQAKMDVDMMLNEKLKMIDDAITKKKTKMDCHPEVPITPAEKMNAYDSVYTLCNRPRRDYSNLVYEKYTNCLTERIQERALPVLMDKHGTDLLTEVMRLWSEYKEFASFLSKIFAYLDRYYIPRRGLLSLDDSMRYHFCNLVCDKLFSKLQEAMMRLLSLERWFWGDSFSNYLRKVDWCLNQEEVRAELYPSPTTKTKILDVMKYIMLERNAEKWAQKRIAEGIAAEDQQHELRMICNPTLLSVTMKCVYNLCTRKRGDSCSLVYEEYTNCLSEIIQERVLPVLMDKHGTELLTEITRLWLEHKELSKTFADLDNFYIRRKRHPSPADSMRCYFCNLVCDELFSKLQEAMMRLVDRCLNQEEARAEFYLSQTTKTKLLDVMKYVLLERNAKKWAQKQNAERMAAEDQELLSKYASLKLE